jgi:hypothetical protein
MEPGEDLARVLAAHEAELMAIEGVNGVGAGVREGKLAIVVMTTGTKKAGTGRVPATIEGYPVVVEPVGDIVAY